MEKQEKYYKTDLYHRCDGDEEVTAKYRHAGRVQHLSVTLKVLRDSGQARMTKARGLPRRLGICSSERRISLRSSQ